MERRMAKEEDVSSHKEESEDAFPRGDQACVCPSLTCTCTGRLTEIPEGPPRAESPFNMWPKRPKFSESEPYQRTKQPSLQ